MILVFPKGAMIHLKLCTGFNLSCSASHMFTFLEKKKFTSV